MKKEKTIRDKIESTLNNLGIQIMLIGSGFNFFLWSSITYVVRSSEKGLGICLIMAVWSFLCVMFFSMYYYEEERKYKEKWK